MFTNHLLCYFHERSITYFVHKNLLCLPLSLNFLQNGVLASVSTDPRLRASKRSFDSEICGLRVTMSGDAVACGDGAGGAGCERQPFARQADRLQVGFITYHYCCLCPKKNIYIPKYICSRIITFTDRAWSVHFFAPACGDCSLSHGVFVFWLGMTQAFLGTWGLVGSRCIALLGLSGRSYRHVCCEHLIRDAQQRPISYSLWELCICFCSFRKHAACTRVGRSISHGHDTVVM